MNIQRCFIIKKLQCYTQEENTMKNKMIKCKTCGADIASDAKTCPSCGSKNNKSFYKKWWFWHIIIILCIIALANSGSEDKTATEPVATNTEQTNETTLPTPITDQEQAKESSIPAEYKSALNKAQIYSDTMYMSKNGIYEQLTSEYGEKFSAEAAQYAIDNLDADWNENALKKAEMYQSDMSMSPEAIRDQLTSEYGEKFTAEEAAYAIEHLSK